MKPKSVMPFTLLAVLLTVLLAACGGNAAPKTGGQAPTVRITSPTTSATDQYSLEGVIVDNDSVDNAVYSLNGGEAQELQLTDNAFSVIVMLQPGTNSISVTATDKAGNTGEDSTTVTYNAPPAGITTSSDIAAPGSILTIDGQHFGTSGTINLGGMTIMPDIWTDTEITLTIPAGAPAGPRELTITTNVGSETIELFVGFDFPEGTLEELVALNLPRGTAVRLGEGTFESTSALLAFDNLSFYGQGETRTTLKAMGSIIDPRLLVVHADPEFDLIMTDVTLETDATAILATPLEMPEDFAISSFKALSSLTADPQTLMHSLQAEAGGSFTTARYGVDFGSYELRNVAITGGADGGGVITSGYLIDVESIYMGHLVLDNVSFDNNDNMLYLGSTDTIEIRNSTLNPRAYQLVSLHGKIIIDKSQLTSNDSIGSDVMILGMRGLELTNSKFTALDAKLSFMATPDWPAPVVPNESIISKNIITSRSTTPAPSSSSGIISMSFSPIATVVEKNTFSAENQIYFESDGWGLTIDDNTFTVGHPDLTDVESLSIGSGYNTFVAFNNNEVEFLSTAGLEFSGSGSFIVNDNVINGSSNSGTALIAAQEWSDEPFSITAQRNTFTGFENALDLYRSSGPGEYKARINNNAFNFTISSAPQAARLRGMVEGEVDLDATNNTWGANTAAADVQSYIAYQDVSDIGVLKVDPITLP